MHHDGGDFRATSDQMLGLIDQLRAVERVKQHLALGSPELIMRAHEAERLGRLIVRWSQLQVQMAEAAPGRVERGELSPHAAVDVKPRRLDRILANWREAQLRLEIARPDSPEAETAAKDVERLREEYRAAQALRMSEAGDGRSAS